MAYIGNQPSESFTSFATQEFTTSATTSYTLDHAVTNENEIALFINNVRQQPGSGKAYTASGTTLTLSAATASTDTMYCVFLGRALQTVTPATNSITAAMVGNDLISGKDALTDEPADTDEFLISDAGTLKRIDASLVGGSYKLLTTTTASNVSSFAINGFFSSTYDIYKLFLFNVYGANSDQDIRMRVNTTGSYTEQTAQKYFYVFNRLDGTTSNSNNSEEAVQYESSNNGLMVGRHSDTSTKLTNSEITLFKPSDSSNFFGTFTHFGGWNSGTEICTGTSTGFYTVTTAVTGVTILSQSGNIYCEKAYLYGLKT